MTSRALASALDAPTRGYRARARAALEPYGAEAVQRLVAEQLVARLLG